MMTKSRTTHWGKVSRINIVQISLAMLALLCAVSAFDSRSAYGPAFFGRDFETITGRNSTTEVFTHGGRYILHDYSALAPGCNDCDDLEFQVDTAVQLDNRAPDTFNRLAQVDSMLPVLTHTDDHALFPSVSTLIGLSVSPTSPPPR